MVLRAALLCLFATAGCYSLPSGDCAIRCGSSDRACPGGYSCLGDGFCHDSASAALCTANPDAGGGDDGGGDGGPPDGPPVIGCDVTGCPPDWDCVHDTCEGGDVGGFVLDVKTFAISGTVTQNGAQPTSTCTSADRATVLLDDDVNNYHFALPVPCTGTATPFAWSGTIFPGTYRVTVKGGLSSLPTATYVARPALAITAATSNLVLDVSTFAVSGAVTQNGAQPTSTCTSADRATVLFDDNASNYHFAIAVPCNGASTPFAYAGTIYPGTYRVTVQGGLSSLPAANYIARPALALSAATANLVLDVSTFAVSGAVTQNGAQPTSTCTSADRATVLFDDNTNNYHFTIPVPCAGATTPFAYTGTIFPGTYRVTVKGGLSSLPAASYIARPALALATATANLALDVATFPVSGAVTQNGAQPTSTCTSADRATVLFDDNANDYHFTIPVPCNGTTTPFAYAGTLFPGTYRVTVRGGLSSLPPASYVARPALALATATANLALDVATFQVSGIVTQNGAQPTSTCTSADRATVQLDDNANNYHFVLPVPCAGTSTPFAYTGTIFPGTYRITVKGGLSSLPAATYLARTALALAAATPNLALDVRTLPIAGTVTQNGAQPTSTCTSADRATVHFDDPSAGYSFAFPVPCAGTSTPFAFTGTLFPGLYHIAVQGGLSSLPSQSYVIVGKLKIE